MRGTLLRLLDLPDSNSDLYPKHILKDALADCMGGRIDYKALLGICYYWSYIHCLDLYKPKPLPAKPYRLVQFDKLPLIEKKKFDPESLDKQNKERQEYLDELSKIKLENQTKYRWLEKMKSYFQYRQQPEKVQGVESIMAVHERSDLV